MKKEEIKKIFPEINEIPESIKLSKNFCQNYYLVNGELREWSGAMQSVNSPILIRTNEELKTNKIGEYPLLTETESLEVLDAALAAYDNGAGEWPTMSVEQRIARMYEFVDRMKLIREEVVKMLIWEIGKTLVDAEKEFDRTVLYIEDTLSALKKLDHESSSPVIEEGIIGQIRRAPLGVVLCMGPFNYPLNETFTTLIPAMLMGNTIIMKPPKYGVLLHAPFLEIFRDVFPKGVINTIYGDGKIVVSPIISSGKISVLAFIGSSKVADILKKQCPNPHRLRSVLGLEAKNAAIVLSDSDIELATSECVLGGLTYNGQRCTALKIIFVHRNIVDKFVELISKKVDGLKVGMPWEKNISITPLPEDNKVNSMQAFVDDAVMKGAKIKNKDGGVFDSTLMTPAVLYPVSREMRIYNEEQFGPIMPIVSYDRIEEVIEYIVNSNYGQQVSIFGTDYKSIARLIDPLVNQVCRVNINSQCQRGPDIFPFTGRKDSAEGTLSVSDALRVFSIRSLVAARENDVNKEIIKEIIDDRLSNFLSTEFIF